VSKQLNLHCVIFYVPYFITPLYIQTFSLAFYIGVLLLKNEGKMSKPRCRVWRRHVWFSFDLPCEWANNVSVEKALLKWWRIIVVWRWNVWSIICHVIECFPTLVAMVTGAHTANRLGGHGHWGTYSKPSWTSELLFDLHQGSSVALMRFVVFITLKTKTVVFWFIKPCNLMIANFGRNVLSSSCGTGCGRKTWRFLS